MCFTYFIYPIIAFTCGIFFFLIYGKERDVYQSINELSWIQLILKFLKKFFQNPRQGVIKIDRSLMYLVDAGNDDFPFILSARNHKITVHRIRITDDDVTQYKTLCGYKTSDTIPVCYAEVLFTKALIALITSTKFCLSPVGLIHIRQQMKQSVSLLEYVNMDLTAEVAVKKYRQNDRGVEVDISTRLFDLRNTTVWEGTTTLFSRKTTKPRPRRDVTRKPDMYEFSEQISVSGDCGVKYAKVSGDWNLHHLYWWTAWFLGFSKPIAHGMWTLSRALAVVQHKNDIQLDGKHEISCEFKRPLLMPGKVTMKFNDPDEALYKECKIRVEDAATGVPHLLAAFKTL